MEQALDLWVAPLLIMPGMALLVLSTSARYSQLLLHEHLKLVISSTSDSNDDAAKIL